MNLRSDSDVTLAAFMRDALENRGLSRKTIIDVIPCAAADIFRYDDQTSISQTQLIRDTKAVVRSSTAPPKQKLPITKDMLTKMVSRCTPSEASIRNTFMVIIMFLAFLREDELVNLRFNDIWVENLREANHPVLFIYIEKSKNDQARFGHTVVVEADPLSPICPVKWFMLHLRVRRSSTHIFHSSRMSASKLGSTRPNGILKSLLTLIGIDPTPYGSHSLRRGGVTAASPSVRTHILKRHGNWRSNAIYTYINDSVATKLSVGRAILNSVSY